MRTVVISDLHLGAPNRRDVLRLERFRAPLLAEIERADQLVLLGDVVELRGTDARAALDAARPVLAAIGAAAGAARVVLVPGNHDHRLAADWLDRRRRGGAGPLGPEQLDTPDHAGLYGVVARALEPAQAVLAYPGLFVRPDVYATHGHYLDCHNTVPAIESLAASAVARATGTGLPSDVPSSPDAYEAILAPLYAFLYELAQAGGRHGEAIASAGQAGAAAVPASEARGSPAPYDPDATEPADRAPPAPRGGNSLRIWQRLRPPAGQGTFESLLLGGVVLPGVIGALNMAGLGPFEPDLSRAAIRRGLLSAMGAVVETLGIEAEHVLFGHTHRAGPLPNDDDADGWALPGGGRLVNSGNWVTEPALLTQGRRDGPYAAGRCVIVEETGPPRLELLV